MVIEAGVGQRLRPVLERIEQFVSDGEVAGAGLAVAIGNEPLGEWYYGQAAANLPAGPDVLWPLASLTKPYTAATILSLVERGGLTLTTPVSSILPAFTGDGREQVSLGHLLTHTSGLVYESPKMEERLRALTPIDALVDEAYTYALQFPPGTRHSYSDYGYAIAGRMASVATGRPFPELVRSLLLEPAGLEETFMPPPAAVHARLAHVWGSMAYGSDGAMYNSAYALALAHPAFGTVASLADLLRFGLLFVPSGGRGILSAASARVMTTDQTGGNLPASFAGQPRAPQPWGMGFSIRGAGFDGGFGFGDLMPAGSYGHGGASGCVLAIDPSDNLTVAYVSNRHAASDFEGFRVRNTLVLNGVVAALTRRDAAPRC